MIHTRICFCVGVFLANIITPFAEGANVTFRLLGTFTTSNLSRHSSGNFLWQSITFTNRSVAVRGPLGVNLFPHPDTSYYFETASVATYAAANAECGARFPSGELLQIETQEEFARIGRLVQAPGYIWSSYWIRGRYATGRGRFEWDNLVPFGPWTPWDAGHPNSQFSVTRVFLRAISSPRFRTQFSTVASRFICEVKLSDRETEPEPCYRDNDLVIAIDSSGSITRTNYTIALDFVARLAAVWKDNPRNRVAIIIYSDMVETRLSLNQNITIQETRNRVLNSRFHDSGTNSHLALNSALEEFHRNTRPDFSPNLIFLTDGESNDPTLTREAAQRVINAGVRTFSVGIGPRIMSAELLAISGNDQSRVFNTHGFYSLLNLLKPLSQKVCNF